MIRSVSINLADCDLLCYITLNTSAMLRIPFCQALDSEIQIFENLFLLKIKKIILAVGCVCPEE